MIKTIDAKGIYYKELNDLLLETVNEGATQILLENVNGQRYIGTRINKPVQIEIRGVPGNDLGAFMDGPTINVYGSGQDAVGNTMNSGKIIVHGHAGDVLGYAMRGGKIFVRDDVGYRVAIHMKEYRDKKPLIIAGGCAGDFFAEYMAGGVAVLLGLNRKPGRPIVGDYLGTGMHGGVVYLREKRENINPHYLGKEVAVFDIDEKDREILETYLTEFCSDLNIDLKTVMDHAFTKVVPVSHRPYGKLYTS